MTKKLFFLFYLFSSFTTLLAFEAGILERAGFREHSAKLIEGVNIAHTNLGEAQQLLYNSLCELGGPPPAAAPPRSSSHSSQSQKRDASKNWGDSNFALGLLVVVKKDGSSTVLPMGHPEHLEPARAFLGECTLYDSCYDRTHNQIPSPAACEAQWGRYLPTFGDEANPFGKGWKIVKKGILDNSAALEDTVKEVKVDGDKRDLRSAVARLGTAKDALETLQEFITKWIRSGWHSEQRFLFDLDSEQTLDKLRAEKDVSGIIACLHTRLFPCSDTLEKSCCSCHTCLINWPAQWRGREIFRDIPLVMTVSFFEYPKADYAKLLDGHYIQLPRYAGVHRPIAEKWVRTSLLKRQINPQRLGPTRAATRLPFEEGLCRMIFATFGALQVSYEDTPDLVDCRALVVALPDARIIRKFIDASDSLPRFASEIMTRSAIVSIFPIKMRISTEEGKDQHDLLIENGTDWDLVLRLAFMHSCGQ